MKNVTISQNKDKNIAFSEIFKAVRKQWLFISIAVLSASVNTLDAQTGFNSSFAVFNANGNQGFYCMFSTTSCGTNGSLDNLALGTFVKGTNTLFLKGAENNVFKCGGANISGTFLQYRIYPAGSPSGGYTTLSIGYESENNNGSCIEQRWKNIGYNVDMISSLPAGNYTIEIYSLLNSSLGDRFLSNNGANYKASFTVADAGFNSSFAVFNRNGADSSFCMFSNTTCGANAALEGTNLGSFCKDSGALILKGAELNVFRCFGSNITGTFLSYRVYPTGSPTGSYIERSIDFNIGDGSVSNGNGCSGVDQRWRDVQENINLTNLNPGNYTIEIYARAATAGGDKFLSNLGNNYKATFTVSPQPAEPAKVNCWDTFTFNTTTCEWVNNNTAQPAEPAKVNCWDTFTFNTTTCAWENDNAAQPEAPAKVNCWDTFTFNTTTCEWVNNNTAQPAEPAKVNCWDTFTFNTTTCEWVNNNTVQPAEPAKVNCWDTFTFNTTTCAWENDNAAQPEAPAKVNCWDTFTFNTTTCEWVNNNTAQPAEPAKVNCWDTFTFNTTTCEWVNNNTAQPAEPAKVNCWDNFVFNTTTCVWDNTGTKATEPTKVNCWDNFVFNTTTCVWDNTGTKATEPTKVNCWDNFVFNTTTCVWDNTGTKATEPTKVNCWDNFVFNTTTCVWDNTGTKATEPTKVNCWDNFVFNTTSCAWNNVGTTLTASFSTNNAWLYYGYSGDQTAMVSTTVSGGTAPYTVTATLSRPLNCNVVTTAGDELWVPGSGTVAGSNVNTVCPSTSAGLIPSSTGNVGASGGIYSVTVSLMADAVITFTITDANGCTTTSSQAIEAEDVRCFAGNSTNTKITICHRTGSTKNPCVAICVDYSALQEHLDHGDYVGTCIKNCVAPTNAKQIVVEEEINSFKVTAYPNPSNSQFTLLVEGGHNEKVEVLVYDMMARLVKRFEKTDGQPIQFGEELPRGEYLTVVKQGENMKAVNLIKK